MELSNILKEINVSGYVKIGDLEKGKKYMIKHISAVKMSFGKRICIKSEEFQFLLPESWFEKIPAKHMDVINKSEKPIYLLYKGLIDLANGKTKHDIELVMD